MNGEILEGVKNSINWRVEFMACLTTEMCSFQNYKRKTRFARRKY
jgi:hypothetical protein